MTSPRIRLLGGRVRDHDSTRGFALLFGTPDHDTVMQGTKLHGVLPLEVYDLTENMVQRRSNLLALDERVPIIVMNAPISGFLRSKS
jgi:hypothetical protein